MAEEKTTALAERPSYNREQIELLKRTVAAGTTDDEFALFGEVVRRTGLDPFTNQIYMIVRGSGDNRRATIQTGIDGYRLIAERTGELDGQDGPYWCGPDGRWSDVWLDDALPPFAAKVTVFRKGQANGYVGVARLSEYQQKSRDGKPTSMWVNMPTTMLAKCAEALALRKAFPRDLSGLYTTDEMEQAQSWKAEPKPRGTPRSQAVGRGKEAMSQLNEQRRAAQPPPPQEAAQERPAWIVEVDGALKNRDLRFSDLSPVTGAPVTQRVLERWVTEHTREGDDPVKALLDAYDAAVAPDDVDLETGEVIEGEAHEIDEDADPDQPLE